MKTVDYKQQIISKPVDNYARKDWAGKYKISEKRHLDDTLQKLSFLYFLIALQQQACSILVGGWSGGTIWFEVQEWESTQREMVRFWSILDPLWNGPKMELKLMSTISVTQ